MGARMGYKSVEQLWNMYVIPEPNSGCWLWTGYTHPKGYGYVSLLRRTWKVHRLSWEHYKGQIPDGLWVLHKCDVRCCVNPDHLFLGTNADNVADKVRKGRAKTKSQWGETNGFAKLTAEQVRIIRISDRPGRSLAKDFGVHESTVSRVRGGTLWKQP